MIYKNKTIFVFSGISTNLSKENLPNETALLNSDSRKGQSGLAVGKLSEDTKDGQSDDFSDLMDYLALDSYEKKKFRAVIARMHPVVNNDADELKKQRNPTIGEIKKMKIE